VNLDEALGQPRMMTFAGRQALLVAALDAECSYRDVSPFPEWLTLAAFVC
jgi:hypothetical protein